MAFEILVGGVGDAFSLDHYGTHFLLKKDGFVLAIDCPDDFRRGLRDHRFSDQAVPLEVNEIDALYLTHLHGDHVNGLEMTLAYRALGLNAGPLPIYGLDEVLDDLWPRRLQVSLGRMYDGERWSQLSAERFFAPRPLSLEASNQIGPFGIELHLTRHHLTTTAMKITDGHRSMAYSCDTAFDRELIDWLADGADLIFHECTFGAAHTQFHQLQTLPEEIQQRIVLVHYPNAMVGMDTGAMRMARQGERFE